MKLVKHLIYEYEDWFKLKNGRNTRQKNKNK